MNAAAANNIPRDRPGKRGIPNRLLSLGTALACWLFQIAGSAAAPVSAYNPSATDRAIPKRCGTLRLALPSDLSSLDPALAYDTISGPFLLMLYQGFGPGTTMG